MGEGLFGVKVMLEDPDGARAGDGVDFYGNDSRLMKHVDQLWTRIEASRP